MEWIRPPRATTEAIYRGVMPEPSTIVALLNTMSPCCRSVIEAGEKGDDQRMFDARIEGLVTVRIHLPSCGDARKAYRNTMPRIVQMDTKERSCNSSVMVGLMHDDAECAEWI